MSPRGLFRVAAASSIVAIWLAFLTSRQTALYPTVAQPAVELVPASLAFGAVALAVVGRLVAPSTSVAVVCMAALSWSAALLAAQLGLPLRMPQTGRSAAITAETSAGRRSWAASSRSLGGRS